MCKDVRLKVSGYLKKARPWFENLEIVKKNKLKQEDIEHFYEMAISYYRDSIHFYEKSNYINSLSALEYAEGWLDAGKSIGIFRIRKK
ncbi:MAG TPA: DUF357 domain-containing protein [Candidatus Altiarchaeales archaeon]|nr:DUF357 domain-containing protein [Candidatus Altiarchaeales archaeon]